VASSEVSVHKLVVDSVAWAANSVVVSVLKVLVKSTHKASGVTNNSLVVFKVVSVVLVALAVLNSAVSVHKSVAVLVLAHAVSKDLAPDSVVNLVANNSAVNNSNSVASAHKLVVVSVLNLVANNSVAAHEELSKDSVQAPTLVAHHSDLVPQVVSVANSVVSKD